MIVKACCIIHNMVCKSRRSRCTGTTNVFAEDEDLLQSLPILLEEFHHPESTYEQETVWRKYIDGTEDAAQAKAWQNELVEHIWNMTGEAEE